MGEYAEHGIELSTSAMSLGYKVGSAAHTHTDGNVVFSIENGKHVGYKFPDGKVVNVDELPAEMGEYAEHGIELSTSAMSLGYKVGSAKAQAEATIATTLEFVKSTIEGTARDAKAFTEKQDQVNKNLEGGVDVKLAAVDSKLETAATQQAAAAAQQKKATEDALAKLKADLTADVKTQLAAGMMWVCVGVGMGVLQSP